MCRDGSPSVAWYIGYAPCGAIRRTSNSTESPTAERRRRLAMVLTCRRRTSRRAKNWLIFAVLLKIRPFLQKTKEILLLLATSAQPIPAQTLTTTHCERHRGQTTSKKRDSQTADDSDNESRPLQSGSRPGGSQNKLSQNYVRILLFRAPTLSCISFDMFLLAVTHPGVGFHADRII